MEHEPNGWSQTVKVESHSTANERSESSGPFDQPFCQCSFTRMDIYGQKNMFPPGLEPGTFRVLGERDNHYTTETLCNCDQVPIILSVLPTLMGRN